MNPPDWKTCNEGELWRYVAWHLEGCEIPTILVGGAVVAIYSEGRYRSGDLDMILEIHRRADVMEAMEKIGFIPDKSRYFKHPECSHLYIEFPPGPVELGEEYPVYPAEIPVAGRVLKLLSPTDCVKDRLAAYIHLEAARLLSTGGPRRIKPEGPHRFRKSRSLVQTRRWILRVHGTDGTSSTRRSNLTPNDLHFS